MKRIEVLALSLFWIWVQNQIDLFYLNYLQMNAFDPMIADKMYFDEWDFAFE